MLREGHVNDNSFIVNSPQNYQSGSLFTSINLQDDHNRKPDGAKWNNKMDFTAAEMVGPHIKILSITGIMGPHQQEQKERFEEKSITRTKLLEDNKITQVPQLRSSDLAGIETLELQTKDKDHKQRNVETEKTIADNKKTIFTRHSNKYETVKKGKPELHINVVKAKNISVENILEGVDTIENKLEVHRYEVTKPNYVWSNATVKKVNKITAVKVIEPSSSKVESKSEQSVKTIFATENKPEMKDQNLKVHVSNMPSISVVTNEIQSITVPHGTSQTHDTPHSITVPNGTSHSITVPHDTSHSITLPHDTPHSSSVPYGTPHNVTVPHGTSHYLGVTTSNTDPAWAWLNVPWFTEDVKPFDNDIHDDIVQNVSIEDHNTPVFENLHAFNELLSPR
jgi:hypothetical protein